jgi:hypothetical protein
MEQNGVGKLVDGSLLRRLEAAPFGESIRQTADLNIGASPRGAQDGARRLRPGLAVVRRCVGASREVEDEEVAAHRAARVDPGDEMPRHGVVPGRWRGGGYAAPPSPRMLTV